MSGINAYHGDWSRYQRMIPSGLESVLLQGNSSGEGKEPLYPGSYIVAR